MATDVTILPIIDGSFDVVITPIDESVYAVAVSAVSGDSFSVSISSGDVSEAEKTTWNGKQDELVSGTNIKTINSQSLLGSGNIVIEGGGDYTHPETHPPSIIEQDSSNRFVSDTEKSTWNGKADLESPEFTGTPSAPTATAGTNTTQLATTAFIQAAIAALLDSSPETLNTLNELAAALGDDPNFAATVAASLGGKVNTSDVLNALTETVSGKVLDARQGKVLNDSITVKAVIHGATAGTARPTALIVIWIGTVEPTNATNNDIFINIS